VVLAVVLAVEQVLVLAVLALKVRMVALENQVVTTQEEVGEVRVQLVQMQSLTLMAVTEVLGQLIQLVEHPSPMREAVEVDITI
jgi:hypothetical protein